jgi:hypothetical protein
MRPFGFARLLRAVIASAALGRLEWRQDVQRLDLVGDAPVPATRPELLRFFAARLEEARRELAALTPERLVQALEALTVIPGLRDLLLNKAGKENL